MKKITAIAGSILLLLMATSLYAAQTDNAKCKDFTLFSKMPESWAYNCDQRQFDDYNFVSGKGKTTSVEGKFYKITFYPNSDAKQKPSELQIRRNYENAVQKIGGTIVGADRNKETFKYQGRQGNLGRAVDRIYRQVRVHHCPEGSHGPGCGGQRASLFQRHQDNGPLLQ